MIVSVNPFEILLYKVIMGDTSDNIPKIKKGFGKVAFGKFLEYLKTCEKPEQNASLVNMARWISMRFAEFTKQQEHDVFNAVYFNLQMVWLNLSVYNENNYLSENGKSLLENMIDNVSKQKDQYNYNKSYSLEEFYGMIIK